MISQQKNTLYSLRLLKLLVGLSFLLLFIHIALQYLNWIIYYQQVGWAYELTNRFDLDDEASVPTWFSQILFFLIGVFGFILAYLQPAKALKRLWKIMGVIGIVFAIDEIAGLHEFALQTLHNLFYRNISPTSSDNAWLLVAPFILLAFAWVLWQMVRLLPRRTVVIFVIAAFVFLSGAVGVDMLTSIVERESFLHQGILVAFEETLELLSTVIVVYALAEYLEHFHQKELAVTLKNLAYEKKDT